MELNQLTKDAVLRVGEVCAVEGRRIFVLVDKNKNLSDMFLDGDILRNISVNSFVEIRKGFLSIIGRVEGERIEEDPPAAESTKLQAVNKNRRVLTVSLSGYVDERGAFSGGTKELPLIGNEAYLVTRETILLIHNLAPAGAPAVRVAKLYGDEFDIDLPIDKLFNGHIAIFGNTGSGKTNTLASLYKAFLDSLRVRNEAAFRENTRFLLIDFNGEYVRPNCLTSEKYVYSVSTRNDNGDRLPLDAESLLDLEVLSILTDATDRTQKPFLKRAVRLYRVVLGAENGDPSGYLGNILRARITEALKMSDKIRAHLILDYLKDILLECTQSTESSIDTDSDLEWHNQAQGFLLRQGGHFLSQKPDRIPQTKAYASIANIAVPQSLISALIVFLYVQLIGDVLTNRAQNDHIAPVINRLKSKRRDIDRIFDLSSAEFWKRNVVVVDLSDTSIEMKKTVPLLLCKRFYAEHKLHGDNKTLTVIIDEAHNILSHESSREAESWKDYRLETFEEIIKEGRKFGVFLTISSQRPFDISPTIISQAHNYFIHRLINEADLRSIASSVSYIDRITEESIPTLPTGTCVFSGVASQMPIKLVVSPLDEQYRPQSETRSFLDVVPVAPVSA
ncbi:ATP-binding protein [Ramlibacter ginsenosidimutans]|uniref:ATP-binding protein n=1 Tax=Ramlibacter ginsenosidimutans TaxID=502333 RepID=A0A934WMK0_9BURK|nr:ATP-binding protein [Ramlibacter ginsenosidimutans]MBK6007879.1 ATP-binding protein [Ramlibacter ginsenosidimutans]